jgi:competence ComEA-like helix-hairpin-helix protein
MRVPRLKRIGRGIRIDFDFHFYYNKKCKCYIREDFVMPQPKPAIRKRPELLLGAAALLVAAGALLFMAARNNAPPEPAVPPTTIFLHGANPFEQQQAPLPDGENMPPESYIVGHTVVEIRERLPAATQPAQNAPAAPGVVNINTATAAQLETLPGIGPARAQAILQWRAQNGRFTDPAQLLEISGIGERTLMNMLPFVAV